MEKKINSARFIDQTLPFYMELRGGGGDGWKNMKMMTMKMLQLLYIPKKPHL